MLLGAWLGSVDAFEIDTYEGTKIVFTDGKVISTTLGFDKEATLGTYDDIYLGSLTGFTDGTLYGKFDVFLMRARLRLVDGIMLETVEVT